MDIKKLRLNNAIKLNKLSDKQFAKDLEAGKYDDLLDSIKLYCEEIRIAPNKLFEFDSINDEFLELSHINQITVLNLIHMFATNPIYRPLKDK